MTPAEWLRAAAAERWWSLSADHVRVALTLVAMSDHGQGDLVVTTVDHIAMRCAVNKSSAWRSIRALRDVGFCEFDARSGRGGSTNIRLTPFSVTSWRETFKDHGIVDDSEKNTTNLKHLSDPGWNEKSVESGTLESSLKTLGSDRKPDTPETKNFQKVKRIDPGGVGFSVRLARDLDLLRSGESDPDLISDLRSPTSRDLTGSVETHKVEHSTPGEEPDEDGMSEDQEAPASAKRRRIDPDKIPDRAWRAADYLRSQVLEQNAASFLSTAPWSAEKSGARLKWADSFRRLHDKLLKAMRNADGKATADNAWDEIARTVHWLFHGQGASTPFVVQSPDSLREKWDRIQTVRRNRAAVPPRGADGRPDTTAKREWKTADEWGK